MHSNCLRISGCTRVLPIFLHFRRQEMVPEFIVPSIAVATIYKVITFRENINSLKVIAGNQQSIKAPVNNLLVPLAPASGLFGDHWPLHQMNIIPSRAVSTKTWETYYVIQL